MLRWDHTLKRGKVKGGFQEPLPPTFMKQDSVVVATVRLQVPDNVVQIGIAPPTPKNIVPVIP